MVSIDIQLSGYSRVNASTKIKIESDFLTAAAASLISNKILSWANVRQLDILMKQQLGSEQGGSEYIAKTRQLCGRHLFSMLTHKRTFEQGPEKGKNGDLRFQIIGKEHGQPFINIHDTECDLYMKFPNAYSVKSEVSIATLVQLQVDSRYGHFSGSTSGGQLTASLQRNGPLNTPGTTPANPFTYRTVDNFKCFLEDDQSLALADKRDIYAYFVLQFWHDLHSSKKGPTGEPFTFKAWNGAMFSMPSPTERMPSVLTQAWRCADWFDYAWSKHPKFASAFEISPSYGPQHFPR